MTDWNDALYLRFGDQRTRAAIDLLDRPEVYDRILRWLA